MDIEFHYYITKYLALEAGFDKSEAEIIAYSSQYVDDNTHIFKIITPDKKEFENYMSQTNDITKPEKSLLRIYLLFHYLPGDPISSKTRRRDGKMHLLITTPAGNHAQEIFFDATKNENLYSLGIVSHMLSDTFTHQNFVGTFDEINSMKGVWEKLTPTIGHANAGYKPDIPNLIWHDPRLIEKYSTVENPERIIFAANKLYKNFLFITSFPNNWSSIKKNLTEILSETISESQLSLVKKQRLSRITKYKELLAEYDSQNDYDPYKWLKESIKEKKYFTEQRIDLNFLTDKLSFKKNYEKSDWFKFQEAVKEYQSISTSKLAPLFAQLEIREW